jgi:hypothetical protein
LIAEKTFAPAKIAAFSSQAREAIAVKQARNRKQTRNAPIFATGFPWTQNFDLKAQVIQRIETRPPAQKPHLKISSANYG